LIGRRLLADLSRVFNSLNDARRTRAGALFPPGTAAARPAAADHPPRARALPRRERHRGNAAQATDAKILKLAAIFSLMDLPDCAAEVVQEFRTRIEKHLDVAAALNAGKTSSAR